MLIEVTGRHRERFLASQVTSDVAGLAEDGSQLSALLDRSGRLQAFFYLRKRADAFDILVPDVIAEACVERFESHIIADDVTFAEREVGPMRLAIGPAAAAMAPDDESFPVAGWGTHGIVTWGGRELSLPEISAAELETLRVLGGPPIWDLEVKLNQLINETALLDTAVSFDKGCYLGQETVAKVASHRGAIRAPVLLELTDPSIGTDDLVGEWFGVGERERAGQVLSVARSENKCWLQASLHRELRIIGRELSCVFADGMTVDTEIHAMPLLRTPSREEMADRLTVAASAAFAEDRNDRALELLDRAIAVCPVWADAYEAKGVILFRLGRHPEAIEQMHRLLEVEPSSVMAHSNLSLFHNQLGDIEAAERHLALATRASMASPPATKENDEQADGEAEAAEADRRRRELMFLQVLEIDPDDALAHCGLGEIAVEEGRFSIAADHLEKAIVSDPEYSQAMLALGNAMEGLEDTERAREAYERGIEIAAKKGDFSTAQKMQERLTALST